VVGAAEIERHAEAQIEIAGRFQRIDQLFSIELRAGALDRVDQDVGCNKTFQRRVVGRFAGKIFRERILTRAPRRGRNNCPGDAAALVAF
jgi:hypothetical protein